MRLPRGAFRRGRAIMTSNDGDQLSCEADADRHDGSGDSSPPQTTAGVAPGCRIALAETYHFETGSEYVLAFQVTGD